MMTWGWVRIVAGVESSLSSLARSEFVAVAAGLAVKSVFIGMAYCVLIALSGPYSNALAYVWAYLGIGAFLTGLIVAYRLKSGSPAVTAGFLCALVPTLVFSAVVGQESPNPLGWFLIALLFVPADILAVVGAVVGKVVKLKAFIAAIVIVLVVLAFVTLSAYLAAGIAQASLL